MDTQFQVDDFHYNSHETGTTSENVARTLKTTSCQNKGVVCVQKMVYITELSHVVLISLIHSLGYVSHVVVNLSRWSTQNQITDRVSCHS